MSKRLTIALECAVLAVLGLLLLNAACSDGFDSSIFSASGSFPGSPVLDSAEYRAFSDDEADGTPEAIDQGTTASPGVLGTATAAGQARIETLIDEDTVGVTCTQTLGPAGSGRVGCDGTFQFSFVIDVPGSTGIFEVALVEARVLGPAPTLTAANFEVSIDCGAGATPTLVDLADPQRNVRVEVVVGASPTCVVLFDISSMLSEGSGGAGVVHTASVTAAGADLGECSTGSACPGGRCGPSGRCQTGGFGDACFHAPTHCNAGNPFCVSGVCTGGLPGESCRYDGECMGGHACAGGLCEGDVCASDLDCTDPLEPTCTEGLFCSASGGRSSPCLLSSSCALGLICLSNACTVIADVGEPCPQPDTICNGTAWCDAAGSGNCEPSKGAGEVCSANVECTPPDLSCILGTCALRSGSAGSCDDNFDCAGLIQCDVGTQTCQ